MYNDIDDKTIHDALEKSIICQDFLESKAGKLMQEGATRIWEKALYQLCYKQDLKERDIANLLATIRKFKYELLNEMAQLGQEGEFLYEEAKFRDLINPSDQDEKEGSVQGT